jgi:hypothetical protein
MMDAEKVSEHGMMWVLIAILAAVVFLMADCGKHNQTMRVEQAKHCCPGD